MNWIKLTGSAVMLFYWESSLAMMMTRFAVLGTCLLWLIVMSFIPTMHAQNHGYSSNDIAVQQAVTQAQVMNNATQMAHLESTVERQESEVNELRDSLSTVRGIGIGAAAVIGLLQTLQMILQVKSVRRPTGPQGDGI